VSVFDDAPITCWADGSVASGVSGGSLSAGGVASSSGERRVTVVSTKQKPLISFPRTGSLQSLSDASRKPVTPSIAAQELSVVPDSGPYVVASSLHLGFGSPRRLGSCLVVISRSFKFDKLLRFKTGAA